MRERIAKYGRTGGKQLPISFILGFFWLFWAVFNCADNTSLAGTETESKQKTGTVAGYVILKNGLPAIDAVISLHSVDSGYVIDSAQTDSAGGYRFENVPYGEYAITAALIDPETGKTDTVSQTPVTLKSQALTLDTVVVDTIPADTAGILPGGLTGRETDSLALLALLDSLGLARTILGGDWDTDVPINQWPGVTVVDGRVTGLSYLGQSFGISLPPQIGQLRELRSMEFIGCSLSGLPPEIGQLYKLQALILRANQLAGMPEEVGDIHSLQRLDLEGNYLTGLPPSLAQLDSLDTLIISYNNFDTLPAVIFNLLNLTSLSMGNLRLKVIPEGLKNLKNLRELHVFELFNASVPNEMWAMSWLENLVFSGCSLSTVPVELQNLSGLRLLSLSNNQLTALPEYLATLTSLQNLSLRNNQFSVLPPFLSDFENLTRLDLSGNGLTSLPDSIIRLESLTFLDLGSNRLCGLSAGQTQWAYTYDPEWADSQDCP